MKVRKDGEGFELANSNIRMTVKDGRIASIFDIAEK